MSGNLGFKEKRKLRRRKNKRRTGGSDSSSSEESGNETAQINENVDEIPSVGVNKYDKLEISDDEMEEDVEEVVQTVDKIETFDVTQELNKVSEDMHQFQTEDKEDGSEMKNKFLGLLFENYGEDINKLREAPDFTNKSLSLLANVLKDGSEMFDKSTLKTIFEDK